MTDDDAPDCRVCGEPLETEIERHRETHTDCHVGRI